MQTLRTLFVCVIVALLAVSAAGVWQAQHTVSQSVAQQQATATRSHTQSVTQWLDQIRLETLAQHHRTEIDCLARNMYFEARGEGVRGQQAVAFVTMNRVRSARFPDTVCDVVYQARRDSQGRPLRHRCQFSWVCDGTRTDRKVDWVYRPIRQQAEYLYINYLINPGAVADVTDGATHFHATRVSPHWSRHPNYQPVAHIGQHVFYQPTY